MGILLITEPLDVDASRLTLGSPGIFMLTEPLEVLTLLSPPSSSSQSNSMLPLLVRMSKAPRTVSTVIRPLLVPSVYSPSTPVIVIAPLGMCSKFPCYRRR